jgi:hypothetical protein
MNPAQIAKDSESSHQIALFAMCALNMKKYPELKWLHAIPNGGLRDKITAGKLKAEGLKSGILDVFLPVKRIATNGEARIVFSGLYVEMKKPSVKAVKATSKGGASDEQLEFAAFAISQGFMCKFCYSWEEAWKEIEFYLNIK